MKRLLAEVCLIALPLLGLGVAPLPAQGPGKPVVVEVRDPHQDNGAAVGLDTADPLMSEEGARPGTGPVRGWLNRRGLGCYAPLSTVGCSSLRREIQFMFGSCRSFFGESCQPPPPREGGGLFRAGGCR
jgi:hypothetical protein